MRFRIGMCAEAAADARAKSTGKRPSLPWRLTHEGTLGMDWSDSLASLVVWLG